MGQGDGSNHPYGRDSTPGFRPPHSPRRYGPHNRLRKMDPVQWSGQFVDSGKAVCPGSGPGCVRGHGTYRHRPVLDGSHIRAHLATCETFACRYETGASTGCACQSPFCQSPSC